MKKLLLILLFIPVYAFTQEYSEIVDVPNKTSSQLYATAKEWFTLTFKSGKHTIDLDDPINGKLIGKGFTTTSTDYVAPYIASKLLWDIDFTIEIAVKDNKYKTTISEIFITNHILSQEYITNNNLIEGIYEKESLIPKTEPVNFSTFIVNKEYYKNGSNLEWLFKENEKNGLKIKRNFVKINCAMNEALFNNICQTEDKMYALLESLKLKMGKIEENW